jgi:hypothetical protein
LSHPLYVETFGPEVAEIGALAGFSPDPEQQLFLDLLFAIGPSGKSVSFESCLIGPRQNLKTGTVKLAELGWLFVTEQRLIVHSAHELDSTEEAFNDLRELIENTPQLSRHLDPTIGKLDSRGVVTGNGKWSLFVLGSEGQRLRVKYKARTANGGRGLTGNKIVLDEAFALTPSMIGALYPTLSAVPDPQVLLASSAGKLESAFLRSVRDRGRAGGDPALTYMEYADDVKRFGACKLARCDHAKPPNNPPGCALDDPQRWRRFMTALGRRIDEDTIRKMRGSMPPAEFAREFMVWWDDPATEDGESVVNLATWSKPTTEGGCKDPAAPAPERAVLTVDVEPDRQSATIAAAGDGPGGRTLVITTTQTGTSWVADALKVMVARRNVVGPVRLVQNAQAGSLVSDLKAAGIEWEPISSVQSGQACSSFIRAVEDRTVVHVGQAELDRAVGNATTRFTANGEVEQWDRRDRTVSIGPVVAASTARLFWGLVPKTPVAPPVRHSSAGDRPRRNTGSGFNPRTSGF